MEGYWKFQGGRGFLKAKFLETLCMKINQNFLGGGGVQNKKPSVGRVWIFSGTVQVATDNTDKPVYNGHPWKMGR